MVSGLSLILDIFFRPRSLLSMTIVATTAPIPISIFLYYDLKEKMIYIANKTTPLIHNAVQSIMPPKNALGEQGLIFPIFLKTFK